MNYLILFLAMLAAGCSKDVDTTKDYGRIAAPQSEQDVLLTELGIPTVNIDSRYFRQTWGKSESSLELAEYLSELEHAALSIEEMTAVTPHWERLAEKLRNESRDKLLGMTRGSKGVSQAYSILTSVAAGEGFASGYREEFQKNWEIEYEKNVRRIPLNVLFDAVIEGIRDGSLRDQLKDIGVDPGKIPMRLVRKASKARNDKKCVLDSDTTKTRKPSRPEQLWGYVAGNCYARKTLFASVKGLLIEARKNPKVQQILAREFEKQFPPKFQDAFRDEYSRTIREAHLTLLKKVDASTKEDLFPAFSFIETYWEPHWESPNPWSSSAPRIPAESKDPEALLLSLSQLGMTLGAQTRVAANLLDSQDRGHRTLGLIAAYAAMEKMFFLIGRTGAVFDKDFHVVMKPQKPDDLKKGVPPEIVLEPRGGSAFNRELSKIEMWDLERDVRSGPGLRVYPQWMKVNDQGVSQDFAKDERAAKQATSDLNTLTSLIDGALSFLELAHSARTFGIKFGETKKLIDPKDRSVLFPEELKELPMAVIATALKTLVTEHLVPLDSEGNPLPSPDSPQLAGLSLREKSGPEFVIDLQATSRALVVMSRLAKALQTGVLADRKDLQPVRDQLATALPFIGLNLGKTLQGSDGGFFARYDIRAKRMIQADTRTLDAQALALQAHLTVYKLYGNRAILKRAARILAFLKGPSMWSQQARFFRSDESIKATPTFESQFRAQGLLRLMTALLKFREDSGIADQATQARQLAERIAEFLETASLNKDFQTLGLITP